jgi:LAGLIDADG endonuclease.
MLQYLNLNLINIHWLCGFINADGFFYISIKENFNNNKQYLKCTKQINITQNTVSLIVMEEIIKFIGFGSLLINKDKTVCRIWITSISNINKFIFLIKETKILGAKALDYADFCKGIDLINNKTYLTKEGISKIKNKK